MWAIVTEYDVNTQCCHSPAENAAACSRQSVGKSGMVPEGTLEEIGVPISLADPRCGQHSVKKRGWGGGGGGGWWWWQERILIT